MPVIGLEGDVIAIAAGNGCGHALMRSEHVVSWGSNYHGQLGDGSVTNRPSPVPVRGLGEGVRAIAARAALMADGSVRRWGGELASDDAGAAAHIGWGRASSAAVPTWRPIRRGPDARADHWRSSPRSTSPRWQWILRKAGRCRPKGLLSLLVATEDLLQPGNCDVVFIEAGVGLTRLQAPGELAVHERFAAVRWHPNLS